MRPSFADLDSGAEFPEPEGGAPAEPDDMAGRYSVAAFMLAAAGDQSAYEALLRGVEVPRFRLNPAALAALGETEDGADIALSDDLVIALELRYKPGVPPQAKRPEGESASWPQVLESVRAYLSLEPGEEKHLLGALCGAVSAVLEDEEPLWPLLVGASGGGKTEAIRLLDLVVDCRVDELTRAGLLSWSVGGKKAKRVGLLTRIPASALVTISDFSTVVTMGDREARARMFAMLRVVYDGSVYRSIGGEPASEGKPEALEWSGHLTLIAAATPAVDTHSSFEGALGERWVMLRQPEATNKRARARARYVVDRKDAAALRAEAQAAAASLVREARKRLPSQLPPAMIERLVDIAVFAAAARTSVVYEGQGRSRVVVGLPSPEEPTRLVGQLARLARCALALGLTEDDALALADAAALDSIPLARLRALRACAVSRPANVSDVHRALGRGNRWAAIWELDALEAIGLVKVIGPSRDEDPKAERHFELAANWREVYASVASSHTSPPNKGAEEGV